MSSTRRSLVFAVAHAATVLALVPSEAIAQPAAASEPVVVVRAGDGNLKWNPCPAWMAKGCGIAVLHGDPAKNNADLFFRLPGGAKVPLHWHTSAERMVLVSGELAVTYMDEKPVTLRPGTYAYGPAKKPHSAHCRSKASCVLFIAFEQPVDAVEGAAK